MRRWLRWLALWMTVGFLSACGVDGPVLFHAAEDGGLDASVIPDAAVDAGPQPCFWELEEVDSHQVDAPTSIALDSSHEPHVAYYVVDGPRSTQGWLRYARRMAGAWQTSDVVGGLGLYGWVGLHPSLAMDGLDRPHIAFRDASYDVLRLASWDGTAWQLRLVDSSGSRPALALDTLDRAHVGYAGYVSATGRSDLKLASWDGSTWQIQTLVNDGDIRHVSLALDGADRAHLAYFSALPGDSHLGYVHWDGLTWHREVVDADSSGAIGAGCRIALDGLDRPHISYLDVAGQRLKHAVLEGAVWRVSVVEETELPGATTGLGFDGADQPLVAVFQTRLSQLSVARFEGNAWLLQLVEGASPGGKHVDLAVGLDEGLHLSFVGFSGGGEVLRYARCVPP